MKKIEIKIFVDEKRKKNLQFYKKRNEKIVKIPVNCVKIQTFCGLINSSFGYISIFSEGMIKKIPPLCLTIFFAPLNFFPLHTAIL